MAIDASADTTNRAGSGSSTSSLAPREDRSLLESLFGKPIFCVGREQYSWEDVVLAGILWGDWAALEDELRQGIACFKRLQQVGKAIPAADVDAAAADFRYERDLIAAEDARAWLETWGLTAEAWSEFLRRSILRKKWSAKLADLAAAHPAEPQEVERALKAEAVCSGRLHRMARKLASRAAVYERMTQPADSGDAADFSVEDLQHELQRFPLEVSRRGLSGLPVEQCRDRMTVLAQQEVAFRKFREMVLTRKAISDQISRHHLNWIRVEYRSLLFPQEEMAREAALCLREDGLEFAAVAAASNAASRETPVYLDEVDGALRDSLLGAREGEVLGPLAVGDEFGLFFIMRKQLPSAEDPHVRRRAEERVLKNAMSHEHQQRVKWLTDM